MLHRCRGKSVRQGGTGIRVNKLLAFDLQLGAQRTFDYTEFKPRARNTKRFSSILPSTAEPQTLAVLVLAITL